MWWAKQTVQWTPLNGEKEPTRTNSEYDNTNTRIEILDWTNKSRNRRHYYYNDFETNFKNDQSRLFTFPLSILIHKNIGEYSNSVFSFILLILYIVKPIIVIFVTCHESKTLHDETVNSSVSRWWAFEVCQFYINTLCVYYFSGIRFDSSIIPNYSFLRAKIFQ